MDLNSGINTEMNSSGTFNVAASQSTGTGPSLWIGNYPQTVEMQQLNAQMGGMSLANTGGVYPDNVHSQNGMVSSTSVTPHGQYYVTSVQQSPAPNGTLSNMYQTDNLSQLNNNVPTSPASPVAYPNQLIFPSTMPMSPVDIQQQILQTQQQIAYLEEMRNKTLAGMVPQQQETVYHQVTANDTPDSGPTTITLREPKSKPFVIHQRSSSAPVEPRPVRVMQTSASSTPEARRAQRSSTSETSSTTSSTSIPGSPSSAGVPAHFEGLPLSYPAASSDDGDSPRNLSISSPQNSPRKPGNPAIRSQSLKYSVKFPQDKCYRCMKKVYKMELVGPVKGAVYHKGCFCCKTCGTRLTLNNFTLNKTDSFDVAVYCKSHQPTPTIGAKFDADCVMIKGAMSVPRLDRVNDQIKIKEGKNHVDTQALGIQHCRNVPAPNLQTSNKVKHNTWRIKNRKAEVAPSDDVVKYTDQTSDYDVAALESFDKILVEFDPDY